MKESVCDSLSDMMEITSSNCSLQLYFGGQLKASHPGCYRDWTLWVPAATQTSPKPHPQESTDTARFNSGYIWQK